MEGNIFGTDGIRGRTNTYPIDPETILKIALSTGHVIGKGINFPKVIIGKDTRRSGYMVENALTAGFISMGWEVNLLGPLPTPAVSFLTKSLRADLGIMISASHNPYEDNGIKFFDDKGQKISDEIELLIEQKISEEITVVEPERLGKAARLNDASGRYIEYCKNSLSQQISFAGLKIVLDTAIGAAYDVAP